MSRLASIFVLSLACFSGIVSNALADWPRFRGPNGTGVSPDDKPTPVNWSESENLKWKIALPGHGVSSPIVVGDRVFVTCYSGYGLDRRNPGEQKNLKRHLLCIDRETGKTIWTKAVDPVLPEDPFAGMGVPEHGYASHSPVSDGERVYVYFGKTGALAFDMDGNQLWQSSVGTESDRRGWGSSSSPILYKNRLIVTASAESESIVALDTQTGAEVWRAEAGGLNGVWGTPVLVEVDENRTDLVVGVPYEIWGLNPDTGKLQWYCDAMETDQFNSSVTVHEGGIVAIEGRGGGSIAVRAGGKGDVTESHVVWTGRHTNRFGTPAIYEGRAYFVSNNIANCIDAKTGERVFQSRLQGSSGGTATRDDERGRDSGGFGFPGRGGFGGGDYSSPVIADGKLYFVTRSGDMYVLKTGDKFEQLAVNRVTADNEDFSATPAISHGQLFIRSNKHLYCIAEKETE